MNMTNSLLASTFGVVFASVFISVLLVLLVVFIFFIWWVDKKKKSIKDFFKAVWNVIFRCCEQIHELVSGESVKTVYSDKSMNYSGTEFLPIPQKAPTDKYTYQFLGWDKNGVDENGNVVVRAIYLQKVQKCFINVYNDDRKTLLGNFEVEFGSGLNLNDLKPKKADTKEFSYEFAGWDKDITAFYKNENVYAIYKAIPKKFTYTFFDDDKKTVISQGTAIYGTPIIAPPAPTKQAADGKVFKFAGFANYQNDMTLSKDCSFYAVYDSMPESVVFASSVIGSDGTQTKLDGEERIEDESSPLKAKQERVRGRKRKSPKDSEFAKSDFSAEVVVSNEVKVEAEVVDTSGEVVENATEIELPVQNVETNETEPVKNDEPLKADEYQAQEKTHEIIDEIKEPSKTVDEPVQEEIETGASEIVEVPRFKEKKVEIKEYLEPVSEEKKEEKKEEKHEKPTEEKKSNSDDTNIGFQSLMFNKRKIVKKDGK